MVQLQACCVVIFLAISGCVGGSAGTETSVGTDLDDEAGGIAGLVVSDELFPVSDATVAIDAIGVTASTGPSGHFLLANIPAGTHILNISADGYAATTQEVEVSAGATTDVKVSLTGLPGQAPYKLTVPLVGWSSCEFSIIYSAGPVNLPGGCPFGERKALLRVDVAAEWEGGVYEMIWQTSEEMIFSSHIRTTERPDPTVGCQTSGATHDWCTALLSGRSPLRIIARPEDPVYAAQHAIDGKEMWPRGVNYTSSIFSGYSGFARTEINNTANPVCLIINSTFGVPRSYGCPFGVGWSTGIRFNFFHTTFYRALPADLDTYTAVPD